MTTIEAKKDLFNDGKCFTKGNTYVVQRDCVTEASLMDATTTNDKGEQHRIGTWWREFKIVKPAK